jgi:serine/threonine-protein kinase HipA
LSKEELLKTRYTPEVFNELVAAYLSTGAGIAGMQPKIMVPDRPTIPIPSLIVKAASATYPSLAANEYLCLSAARSAGIDVPSFALSEDGQMLILDRFDLVHHDDGRIERLGFEDIAALAGLRVREILTDRKYQGSYQRIAELLRQLRLHSDNLHRFFQQVAFSVMVRNGDAHLKNFGVLYRSSAEVWLAPMFDVVTTSVYRYAQYPGGPELEDRTLALKLFAGRHRTKAYPTTEELHDFGRRICGVSQPAHVLEAIAEAMHRTLEEAKGDARVPAELLAKIRAAWGEGMQHARPAPATPS